MCSNYSVATTARYKFSSKELTILNIKSDKHVHVLDTSSDEASDYLVI